VKSKRCRDGGTDHYPDHYRRRFKGAIEIERIIAKAGTDPDTGLALTEKDFKLKSIRAAGSGQ
jgi:hypothetical protein